MNHTTTTGELIMFAFISTESGFYKIYDHGDDWRVIGPAGFERWFSNWRNDRKASLSRVVSIIPGAEYVNLVICE